MRGPGVYRIRQLSTGRCYVGSSQRISARWYEHRRQLNRGRHCARFLQAAWIKYGEGDFAFEVLEACAVDVLLEREQYHLDLLRPVFNSARIAGTRRGVPQSADAVEKVRRALTGSKRTPEQRVTMSKGMTGVPHLKARGQKLSPERLKNLIANNRQPRPGGHQPKSQEHRDAISASQAGKPREYSRQPRSQTARGAIRRGALWREARKVGRVIEGDGWLMMLPRTSNA